MHNIDRNQLEIGWETGDYEYDQEAYDEMYAEYGYGEAEGPFNEAEEMELAAELLSVSDEAELDQFLGSLIKKASKGIGKILKSPIGSQLGGAIKGLAKNVLPVAGAALGTAIMPGLGTTVGGMAGNMAGSMFGLELEGMSMEDQEFEIARRFVRFAGDATQEAATMPANVPPQQAAQTALANAAQKHAPGLSSGSMRPRQPAQSRRKGQWVRRGRTIILYGLFD